MSKTDPLAIPGPDAFGFRVNRATPLAKVVAVLRQANPRAPYAQIRDAAESLRLGRSAPAPLNPPSEGEVSRDRTPDRFDSGTDSGVPVAPESAVAVDQLADVPDPTRAEVARWVAEQQGRAKGLEMNKSGRVPKHILQAYREDHREQHLASLVPVVNDDGTAGEPIPADVPPGDVV